MLSGICSEKSLMAVEPRGSLSSATCRSRAIAEASIW